MKNYTEKSKQEFPEDSSFQTLELKANLNPEQRAYLEVLKDKMKKVLGGKTKQELAKAGDLVSLKKYRSILDEILKFLQTKEMVRFMPTGEDADRKVIILSDPNTEVLESKEFPISEIKFIIHLAEIGQLVLTRDLKCVEEAKLELDGPTILLKFIDKKHPYIEYLFNFRCQYKNGKGLSEPGIRKITIDEKDGLPKDDYRIAEYIDGKWQYEKK